MPRYPLTATCLREPGGLRRANKAPTPQPKSRSRRPCCKLTNHSGFKLELKDKSNMTFWYFMTEVQPHGCEFCLGGKCGKFLAGVQNQAFSGCKERINTVVHADLEETNPAKPNLPFPNKSHPVCNSSKSCESKFPLCCSEVWLSVRLTWHESPHWPPSTLFTCHTSYNWHQLTIRSDCTHDATVDQTKRLTSPKDSGMAV